MIRFVFQLFFSLIGFSIIVPAALVAWAMAIGQQASPLANPTRVVIAPGSGTARIGTLLDEAGVIGDYPGDLLEPFIFFTNLLASGTYGNLKAGEYELPAGTSLVAALDKIARGESYQRKITIPEGMTSAGVVDVLTRSEGLSGAISTLPAEGSLLPETYSYIYGEQRQALLGRMQQAMTKTLDELWAARHPDFPLTSPAQAVTLASIVEKETGVAAERARIASVFFNRLQLDMKLQSDPTIVYVLTGGRGALGRRLYRTDLEQTDSPYNTYLYPGLPPGPIANPGRAALTAVFAPEKTPYLYFVADGSGGHVFAETLTAHNRNVDKWRAVRKAAEPRQAAR